MPPMLPSASTAYSATPMSPVVGDVFTPPTVNSMVTFPSEDRIVTVCLPSFSVCNYTAFRYTSMLPASAM